MRVSPSPISHPSPLTPLCCITNHMPRRVLAVVALIFATIVLVIRVREINKPAPPITLAARSVHLIYLDSLRNELLTFAEQYGRPVFRYDTTSPVTGHGRVQLARLRQALFDPRVEYGFGDDGFVLDWRSDPKPRLSHGFMRFGAARPPTMRRMGVANAWPESAAEYARIRRLFVTPQWPEPPARRTNRHVPSGVPPHADAYSILAPGPAQ
jgi:hypothetical protein